MVMRRFVNIVEKNYERCTYSLHRLDVSKHLFYPSPAEADDAAAAAASSWKNDGAAVVPTLEPLPPPCVTFRPPPTTLLSRPNLRFFALVSSHRSESDRIITCNERGHSVLYDMDSHCIEMMPTLHGLNRLNPITISTGYPGAPEEDLFVLHSHFHVLRFGPRQMVYPSDAMEWRWESLPWPPFFDTNAIRSHTVVDGGRTICVSSHPDGFGTFCFDTVEREWWRAGSWVLPFSGGVEYVPDHDIWLGFSPDEPHEHLCMTSDLSTMEQLIAWDQPPVVQHVLQDLDAPKNWLTVRCSLISLGGGRFCVARVFQEVKIDGTQEDLEGLDLVHYYCDYPELLGREFAVFTGVELVTSASSGGNKLPGFRIHKSNFTEARIDWGL